ncbi:hypothetical protein BBAD15_g2173 [Beauveria bassiana D1-5]|uniref:Uncharacterized protein n=1 Tax=Beauveria bassiana D1-5 TaxID=1245745 RepID=A0A0A2WFZ2_BEABA|nr:hypothetical protein BBAD15_g2173 [Beauveria bassiana D1-5]
MARAAPLLRDPSRESGPQQRRATYLLISPVIVRFACGTCPAHRENDGQALYMEDSGAPKTIGLLRDRRAMDGVKAREAN